MTQKRLSHLLELTSDSTVSQWERGVNAPYGKDLVKLTSIFNVSSDYLLGLEDNGLSVNEYKYFPAYVSAGLPNDVEAVTDYETITIPDKIMGKHAGNKNIYFIKVNGESMNKIIPHDSLIAVRPVSSVHELKNDDIVVYRKDSEYAIKRLVIDKDKLIFKPESTDERFYDDVVHIDDVDDLTIKGKVVLYIVNLD